MSLLECISCPLHRFRTAVVWDDLGAPLVETYSLLLERACRIACYLRHHILDNAKKQDIETIPVGVYGSSRPEVVSALLGIMAVPTAAYAPVDLFLPTNIRIDILKKLAVGIILVHHSHLEDFLSQEWNSSKIHFDTSILEFGFVVVSFKDPPSKAEPSANAPRGDKIVECCSSSSMCATCAQICEMMAASRTKKGKETDSKLLDLYQAEVEVSCTLCENNPSHQTDFTSTDQMMDTWAFPNLPPTSLAYMLHTSGTTGLPKYIKVPHCCIAPNVVDLRQRFSINSDDVIFNAAPLTFDPSAVEIFLALSCGATLLIVPEKIKKSPTQLAAVLLHRQHVTVMQVTPALIYRLPEAEIKGRLLGEESCVRTLAFGGETCPSLHLLAKWKDPKNLTAVFNIYGTTEVSCWATCYHIPNADLIGRSQPLVAMATKQGRAVDDISDQVPIGEPLLGTRLEVRGEDGSGVCQGFGGIWIGGNYRVCLLEGESEAIPGVMRPTGDWGYTDGSGRIYFMGRCDRQIKRSGHRINLDSIQQTLQTLEEVSACVVVATSQHCPLMKHLHTPPFQDLLLAFIAPNEVADIAGLVLSLKSTMRGLLPSYCLPDEVVLVKHLPMSEHGKIDVRALVNYSQPDIYLIPQNNVNIEPPTLLEIKKRLQTLAFRLVGLKSWPDEKCILDLGANSFDVVRVSNQFESDLQASIGNVLEMPELVERLLSKNLNDVATYVLERVTQSSVPRKRLRDDCKHPLEQPPTKKASQELPPDEVHYTAWRRGQQFTDGRQRPYLVKLPTCGSQYTLSCNFKTKWSVNTGQCVDASPLVVQRIRQSPVVYIGSHSHLFFAIEFDSGVVLWQSRLSDRIIGSACVSKCGQYITVGCHDGCVYTMCAETGTTHWCFKSGEESCNSSPCVDPDTGLVWIGSHDQHIYAIDIQRKAVVHTLHVDEGACYASPCINSNTRMLYCATLQGKVAAVNLDTAVVRWVFRCSKPVFSSPSLIPSGAVAVGCVDGCVYVIGNDGQMIGKVSTNKPIFSSSCVAVDNPQIDDTSNEAWRLYCGSYDNNIYCWNEKQELQWKTGMKSEVFSIPCLCDIQIHNPDNLTSLVPSYLVCLCVCSTTGYIYMLDAANGGVLGTYKLSQDIFSSPVVVGDHIVVGCRDDNVYCIQVHLVQELETE